VKTETIAIAAAAFLAAGTSFAAESSSRFASGGEVTLLKNGTEAVHVFTNASGSATFTLNEEKKVWFLVVGGGGAGGYDCAGGGGAGGFVESNNVVLAAGAYTVTVGAGGQPTSNTVGRNGGDSFISIGGVDIARAIGGGGGGSWKSTKGVDGGSGGGSANTYPTPGRGTPGQGNDGGSASAFNRPCGGGGAGAAGGIPTGNKGLGKSGDGGDGLASSITGVSTYYAGGGGGGDYANGDGSANTFDYGLGGLGGGGIGAANVPAATRQAATDHDTGKTLYELECGVDGLGGGGGGGSNAGDHLGRPGGSGTVIIRLSNVDPSSPEPGVTFLGQTASTYDTATIMAELLTAGAGCSTVSLSAQVSTNAAAFESVPFRGSTISLTNGLEAGVCQLNINIGYGYDDLPRYVRLVVENTAGYSATSEVFSLTTLPLEGDRVIASSATALPGLWQAVHSGLGVTWTLERTNENLVNMPGTIIAAISSDANPNSYWGGDGKSYTAADGTVWTLPTSTAYGYVGYMFMKGGSKYNFFSRFHDSKRLAIDGADVITDNNAYNVPVSGTYACATSGWHKIQVWLSGSGGGSGNRSPWPFSFGYNVNGTNEIVVSAIQTAATPLNIDEFDMLVNTPGNTFLWTEIPARVAELSSAAASRGVVTLGGTLCAVPETMATTSLVAYWGPRNGGTLPAAWAHASDLGAFTAEEQTFSAAIPNTHDAAYVRLCVIGADGSAAWSDVLATGIPITRAKPFYLIIR